MYGKAAFHAPDDHWPILFFYLRELLQQDTPRYREALSRYLDVTSKLNEWENLEPYLARARGPMGSPAKMTPR